VAEVGGGAAADSVGEAVEVADSPVEVDFVAAEEAAFAEVAGVEEDIIHLITEGIVIGKRWSEKRKSMWAGKVDQ
jgi:hypothetical protein